MEKLQFHPSVVDLFQEAHVLKKHSKNYWKGIEGLQEEWESIDEDLGEQERITREIYEQIESDLPELIKAGLMAGFEVGGYDSFDWLENEGIIGVEIGNQGYYGCLAYFTPQQAAMMTEKLQSLRERNYIEAWEILCPQSEEPMQGEEYESDFWKHLDKEIAYCQQAVNNENGLLLSYG